MKVLWIGGWAIPVSWMEAVIRGQFPEHEHEFRYPKEGVMENIEAEVVVGYSLGGRILMDEVERFGRVILVAPFVGSKISMTQLKYMRRWLKRDAVGAIADFYSRAGLPIEGGSALPYSIEDLDWGLARLMEPEKSLDGKVEVIVGEQDSLIEADRLSGSKVVNGGHCLSELINHVQL